MKRVICLTILAAIIVAACAVESSARPRQGPQPGSFLTARAESVSALVSQISSNQKVAARYARHFGVSPEELVTYFQNNLKLVTLDRPYSGITYYVSKNGTVKAKQRLVPAGSRVFATADGKPILDWRCGNPFTTRLPAPKPKPVAKKPITTEPAKVVVEEPVVQVAAAQPMEIGQIPIVEAIPPLVPTIEPMVEAVTAPPAVGSFNMAAIGVAVPALLGLVSVRSSNDTPEVPEPTGLVAVGVGASGLICRRWSRRRTRGK